MFDPVLTLRKLINSSKEVSSRKEKEKLFNSALIKARESGYSQDLWEWFNLLYSQRITFGISKIPTTKETEENLPTNHSELHSLLIKLAMRELTGNAAQSAIKKLLNKSHRYTKEVFTYIVQKDPKCGFTVKSLNKLLNNKIQTFNNHKAEGLLKQNADGLTYMAWENIPKLEKYFCEVKYDGRRSYLIIEEGKTPYFVSAIGNYLSSMESLAQEIKRLLGDFTGVLDGELFYKDLKTTQSIVAKKDDQGIETGVCFYVMGAMSISQWERSFVEKLTELSLGEFRSNAEKVIPESNLIKMTENLIIDEYSVEKLNSTTLQYIQNGYEGSVIKDPNAVVERHKESRKGMWKTKYVDYYDAPIVDFEEGTGKWEGMLASFIVNYKGVLSEVSGSINGSLTEEKRRYFWEIRHTLVDKWIRIQSYGITPDGRFRHAGFVEFHEGKNE